MMMQPLLPRLPTSLVEYVCNVHHENTTVTQGVLQNMRHAQKLDMVVFINMQYCNVAYRHSGEHITEIFSARDINTPKHTEAVIDNLPLNQRHMNINVQSAEHEHSTHVNQ